MSCVGVVSGRPCAGERMLFAESIRIRASACASAESGRWTAIWSPSKSALNAWQTSGCTWIALPSTRTGSKAWMPRRWSVGARFSSTGCSAMTSSSTSQTSGTIESTCFFAALMFWTDFRSTSRLMMNGLKSSSAISFGKPHWCSFRFGPVLRGDERAHDLETLDRALLLLALRGLDGLAQRLRLCLEVEVLQQLADRLGAHAAGEVDAEAVGRAEPILELAEELLVVDDLLRLELAEQVPRLLEPVDRVDRRLARVGASRLDVLVHLAHLHEPLHERVEVLLLDLPVGPQAEVADEVADLIGGCRRVRRLERLAEQALAEPPCLLELLLVDALDELDVVLVDGPLRVEEPVEDAVDVLGDRALLRAGRLREVLVQRGQR